MGLLKNLANKVLDEVSAMSPTLGDMRWEQLKRGYEREVEKEKNSSYRSSNSGSKKSTSSKSSSTPKQEKKKPIVPDENLPRITKEEFLRQVKEECSKVAKRYPELFAPSCKLESSLGIPCDEEVYLIHDDSVFQNGKTGFAVTSEGIYCRQTMSRVEFTDFEELASYTKKYDSAHWTIGVAGKAVTYMMPAENTRKDAAHGAVKGLYNKISKAYAQIE